MDKTDIFIFVCGLYRSVVQFLVDRYFDELCHLNEMFLNIFPLFLHQSNGTKSKKPSNAQKEQKNAGMCEKNIFIIFMWEFPNIKIRPIS